MCDVCADFLDLLLIYEEKVYSEAEDHPFLKKDDFEAVCIYIQSWSQRQCMCCFRDPKNFDRFYILTRSVIYLAVCQLKELGNDKVSILPIKPSKHPPSNDGKSNDEEGQASTSGENVPATIAADAVEEKPCDGSAGIAKSLDDPNLKDTKKVGGSGDEGIVSDTESNKTENRKTSNDKPEVWNVQDKEKLLHFLSKVFLANFPLYVAYKHSVHTKLDELTQSDASLLNSFCDLHDPDIPVYLLRNVCLFCKDGGLQAMMACFEQTPDTLPVTLAHAIIAIVCNLKQWLNFRATMQLFIPLRGKVLRYMCNLTDKDLRMPSVKSMADYMWGAVKDPLDGPVTFDRDGMDLAFKYFTSSTLTMRLAGISQINSHINLFNELCNNESIIDIENVGQHLAAWLIQNQIISHIFGPNLHVEVIKQSHIILSFLAMECKITNEHIDIIWQAAQLKHCSKQVHDLLPPLIKNLDGGPVLHLYNLLFKLEPKDHTEQSLYLASALIKFIWTSGGPYHLAGDMPFVGLPKSALACLSARRAVAEEMSSSENSVSMEASNSEDEQGSSPHKTPSEDASDGPTPCKQPRKQHRDHDESSDESDKIDDMEEEDEDEEEDDLKEIVDAKNQFIGLKKPDLSELCIKSEHCLPVKEHIESENEADAEDNMDKVVAKKKVYRKHKKPQKCLESCANLCEVRTMNIEECSEEEASDECHDKPDQQVPALCKATTEFLEAEESSPESVQGGAMSELASLVQRSPHEVHDCRPFLRTFQAHGELMDDMSADEGSYSSRMSNKSEKNMADFDGEDSGCDDELAQLAQVKAHLSPHSLPPHLAFHARFPSSKLPLRHGHIAEVTRILSQFKIENVCQPGNTLLWDLLQDDKITQLGDGLAIEAEKALCTLLCFNTERLIRMKFIEGCLANLANNWSVVVSLRMLPKLFASFQQFRGMDTHHVTTWAEAEHNMMEYFFSNLQAYTRKGGPESSLYTHQMEVQVRLQFLTSVFSPIGSMDSFRLSLNQVDILWQCLATDPRCCDELFSWLLSQSKSKDGHALGVDSLKHLYLRKLPSLEPETMSMTGLALFQQLCNLARIATVHMDTLPMEVEVVGMDHLWRIALRANSTDVSMAAIQYLNSYYVGRQLDHESEFVSQCMAHLAAATGDLAAAEESSLLCIQRALLLLKTHLETFKRRYAYHLRRWALEGQGVGSHVQLIGERGCLPIRITIQPAGMVEKVTLELITSDYVADLRAEVTKWWESLQVQVPSDKCKEAGATPVLGSLLSEGTIRMITQGQELTTDLDEKTLEEIGFKDMQIIFISLSASRQQKKRDSLDTPSALPPPPRESLPTLLLLQPQYFEQLFGLMHTLSSMRAHHIPHTKAQLLSRRVWDILTLLPTSPTLLRGFQHLDTPLPQMLDPASPQKLMYSLYIVESLGRVKKKAGEADDAASWNVRFVQYGGLRHLFDIFMSGVLQRSGGGDGSEWQQDCLASLLKLLCQLGVAEESEDEAPRKRQRKKPPAARLNEAMLAMMSADGVMQRLTSILQESSLPRDPAHYKTGFWGRAQVVHYAMALLVSWVRSGERVRQELFAAPHFASWLQRLVLEDPEPAVRREVCSALYRLCLGGTKDFNVTAHMLGHLMEYLPVAEGMRPQKLEALHHPTEDGKEPYGPACRDFFWLLCQLVDSLDEEFVKESLEDPNESVLDMDALAKRLSDSILAREYLETRHNTVEDDGLIGLLNLACSVMKHNPPFKVGKHGQEFLSRMFDFLFALPDPRRRYLPKCKSTLSRSSAYDLLVELVKGAPDNYRQIHACLLAQHKPGPHSPYPWDYWPHEDGRSDCGYVGLTNLGATCYMASCMQHLYMMPQARAAILRAQCHATSKHEATLGELQRMFAYLLESERKAYNPRSFCKVYTMDHQPLNTGEQKDMAEFFIDLVSKLEEMTPELKKLVKTLFGGVISNNVVSLDCEHVSRTLEEFYTVRCQVADMRNLYESLDEVTVKDTLEGDNMYTCSQCGKKVRAEKRACFKKLPHILCFNTMRYTFNMVTMLKEKVNTHFSFPLRLDMSGYVEKHLMPQRYQEEKRKSQLRKSEQSKEEEEKRKSLAAQPTEETEEESSKPGHSKDDEVKTTEKKDDNTLEQDSREKETDSAKSFSEETETYEYSDSEDFNECYEYDLIGVTVHTGTADGGHYYSFIRDRTTTSRDKWFLFNDAEVKPFDPSQIASECFGGEMTSKTYDSATDKFMDFSFEKTNSAYMLFYEWCSRDGEQRGSKEEGCEAVAVKPVAPSYPCVELSKELEDWIWQDNMHFLNDKNIFEHAYFNFMWQVCGYIPQTLISHQSEITGMAAQLSTSFFMESFIHAKEKPTMVQWVELLTKQFNASQAACEWFLDHMAAEDWWPMQILIKCPNQFVRQMFQRLCIHVIQRLRNAHYTLYLKPDSEDEGEDSDPGKIGAHSCVTRFVRMLLLLMENGAKAHLKHLTEYFGFLNEFSKMGEEETQFLISVRAISSMVNFYLGQKSQDYVEIVSEEEEEDDVIPLPTDKYKPASLEKMITLVASLVEKSRGPDHMLQISAADQSAIAGGKGFPFLYLQIKDCINLNQTRNLIFALCRFNERLAMHIVAMIFQAISKHTEAFFKLLTLMTENPGGSAGLPCFTQLVLQRVWEVAEYCPQAALDWLATQVQRNKLAHTWVLSSMETWVEHFLIGHAQQRVRSAAAYLLVCLVPSQHFKQAYRSSRSSAPHKDLAACSGDALHTLHQVYTTLLRLLKPARHYTDVPMHGTSKLTAYFALLSYCVVSRAEKLMFGPFFLDLWNLFHPKLSEPSISVHHNKQALLVFWHSVCIDCPENVQLILQNPNVTKNIAFNYILADHDDQEVVLFNRSMLPAYYGLLRLCCQQSRAFARQLSIHQNLQWAFKNITPHPTNYSAAVEELFKLIHLFILKSPDSTEQELRDMAVFRRQTLQLYLQVLDGKACWATLVLALRTLIDSDDDRLHVIYHGGLQMAFEAFHTLHVMYHEATACHVAGDLMDLLSLILDMVKCLRLFQNSKDVRTVLLNSKEWPDVLRKLATLLNTYNVPDMRNLCIDLLKEILLLVPGEVIQTLVPLFLHCHAAFQQHENALPMGPYYPRRGHKMPPLSLKATSRPARPILQMAIPHNLEAAKGVDEDYDRALLDFYSPYHDFIDVMCRLAINNECMSESLVNLSAMIGYEGVLLHLTYFPKLWLDVFHAQPEVDRKFIGILIHSHNLVEYVETVLLDEKSSLNNPIIYNFLGVYFPKVAMHVLTEITCRHFETAVKTLGEMVATMNIKTIASKLIGELRTFILVYRSEMKIPPPKQLIVILNQLSAKIHALIQKPLDDLGSPSTDIPTKKVRLSVDDESSQPAVPSPGCSKEADKEVAPPPEAAANSAQCSLTKSGSQQEEWLEILEKTTNELKSILTERKD